MTRQGGHIVHSPGLGTPQSLAGVGAGARPGWGVAARPHGLIKPFGGPRKNVPTVELPFGPFLWN